MTESTSIGAALEQELATPTPWPTDADLEVRARLTAIEARIAVMEAHQLRTDRLLTELQIEMRRTAKKQTNLALRTESKLDSIAAYLKGNGNGHG